MNIDHALDDISKADGDAPTLGGGEVAHRVMTTSAATVGYYAKLATLSFPVTSNVAANLSLVLSPKSASGAYSPVTVTISALQGAGGLSSNAKIEILSSDDGAVAHDDLFLDTASLVNGADIDLWMQSIIVAEYDVVLVSSSFDAGVSIALWNDGAAWQVGAPAGALTITSDWANRQSFTPVVEGSTAAGAATYSSQTGVVVCSGGICHIEAVVNFTGHTGTGSMDVVTGLVNVAAPTVCIVEAIGHATYPIETIYGVLTNTGIIDMRLGATSTAAALPMDADMNIRITATYSGK